ncbi:MAG: MCP four helix bundle domain-containing protein, partial [Rhizobacter sp.]|nr:MCP four helix bundle domain-containing protein [Rhizobacter sp.]
MFSNLRIGVRLIAGFVLVAGISVVVGIVGINNTSRMNDMAEEMYRQELMGLSYVKEANIHLIYIGRARSNYLLATSQAERDKQLAAINKSSAALKDYIEKARPLFVTERAKEIFNAFNTLSDEYHREMQKALGFVISRSVSRPLARAVDAANRLAEGDLSVQIDVTSRDETGQLLQAMQHMIRRLSQVVTEVNSGAE